MDLRDRQNSFTFLRLFLALTVVFSHSYDIGGFGPDPLFLMSGGQMKLGFNAVLCFFIISGYLIAASALRQPLGWFVVNRAARILPGFWTVQLLTALVLAPILIIYKHDFVEGYFHSLMVGKDSALSYLSENALIHLRQYRIADIFNGHPGFSAVNGSLWSLGPEVTCYLYLALFAFFGALRTWIPTAALFGGVYTVHVLACLEPTSIYPVAQLGGFAGVPYLHSLLFRSVYVAFVTGMLCFRFRNYLRWNYCALSIAILLLLGSFWLRKFDLIWPVTLPYITLFCAFRLPFHGAERWGDYSFGIYIYSFPIQQCLVMTGLHNGGFIWFLSASLVLSVAAGVLSWRYVEAPVLDWIRSIRARRNPAGSSLKEATRVSTPRAPSELSQTHAGSAQAVSIG